MKRFQSLASWLTLVAVWGLLLPPGVARGEGSNSPQINSVAASAGTVLAVRDVELLPAGRLAGQLVNAGGQALAGAELALLQDGEVVAQLQTDDLGRFEVTQVRPGAYELIGPHGRQVLRCWAPGTAPPAARQLVLLAGSEQILRAQMTTAHRMLILSGIVVTSGVIGGVIGYNIKDDDDAS